ncbi:MAG: hypothetical protein ACYCSB_03910 [bacterium]
MNNEKVKESIKNVLSGIASSVHNDNAEMYRQFADDPIIKDAVAEIKKGDIDDFFYRVIYPFNNLINGIALEELIINDPRDSYEIAFILKNADMVENHFAKLFERYEGSFASVDKARVVRRSLFNFYRSGQKIEFNYNQKYTYHLPVKIFKDHESIVNLFEGIISFTYGNPDKYLMALKNIIAQGDEANRKEKEYVKSIITAYENIDKNFKLNEIMTKFIAFIADVDIKGLKHKYMDMGNVFGKDENLCVAYEIIQLFADKTNIEIPLSCATAHTVIEYAIYLQSIIVSNIPEFEKTIEWFAIDEYSAGKDIPMSDDIFMMFEKVFSAWKAEKRIWPKKMNITGLKARK